MVNLAWIRNYPDKLGTVLCPRVTGPGCLISNKETPTTFLWKVTSKLIAPGSDTSGHPLEIAILPSSALWLLGVMGHSGDFMSIPPPGSPG